MGVVDDRRVHDEAVAQLDLMAAVERFDAPATQRGPDPPLEVAERRPLPPARGRDDRRRSPVRRDPGVGTEPDREMSVGATDLSIQYPGRPGPIPGGTE